MKYFGLDGEMTTADIETGGRLIQIGVAADTDLEGKPLEGSVAYSALINPGGEYDWSERAEAVHGFTREQVAKARSAAEVDAELEQWLLANGANPEYRGDIIPVGLNVGSFDMPHVKLVLPKTFARFSRRTVDLNALCYALEGKRYMNNVDPYEYKAWKSNAKAYAERTIAKLTEGSEVKAAHDAGYDALLHLHMWRFLRAAIQGEPLAVPQNKVAQPASQIMARDIMNSLGVEKASELSGVPIDFIKGWAEGGRALNLTYLEQLTVAYKGFAKKA